MSSAALRIGEPVHAESADVQQRDVAGNQFSTSVQSIIRSDWPHDEVEPDTPSDLSEQPTQQMVQKDSSAVRLLNILRANYAHRLAFNQDDKSTLLDGKSVSLSALYTEIVTVYGVPVAVGNLKAFIGTLARENGFSPLQQMVEGYRLPEGETTDYLRLCVRDVLHIDEELDYILFRRFMIGAVARVMEPGCKMDNILILQGPQGVGKSTFFEILATTEKFGVIAGKVGDRESRMQLQGRWFNELAEFETVLGPSGPATLKGFLSQTHDRYRPPYGMETETFPRRSVFVGTTNESEFLTDTTGNRRYWPLSVHQQIDRNRLQEIRGKVIGQALRLFESGEQWHLTDEESALLSERLSLYEVDPQEDEPLYNLVNEWASGCSQPFMTETLLDALDVPKSRQTTSLGRRVASILKPLGYVKKSVRAEGYSSPRKMWKRERQLTQHM